jgi:hypothetical protein
MTRKDYVMIADAIKAQYKPHNDPDTIQEIALGLADLLEGDNARFDRARFLSACGVK